jgi:hypothetical protein
MSVIEAENEDMETENEDLPEGTSTAIKLQSINPETWNNIPLCIVKGIKYLTEA